MNSSMHIRGLLRALFAAALLLATGIAHAQTMRIEGTVRDVVSTEPVVSAQVRVQGRMQGTLTDGNGHFTLQVEASAKVLEISHVGYRKTMVTLKPGQAQRLEIAMESAASLPDVVISSGPELVLADKTIHLYDYEFFEGQLMMIIYDRSLRRSKLAIVDARDSILDTELGIEEPGKLIRDCLGNVHALTKHWACQLFVSEKQIGFYTDSLAVFERTVLPCLGNIDAHYYFDYHRFNNQILDYLAYDMEADAWVPFLQVKDKNKMHQLMDPLGIYASIAPSEAHMMALSPEDWKKVGKLDPEFQFEQMVFFYPVSAPLRVIDGQVYVFDHLNGLIRSFEKDGQALREVPIAYHKLPNWQRSIIVDEERSEAYALYEKHGYSSLRKIDLVAGTVGDPIEIPKQFPNKIGVRDGIAYFMYKQGIYDETNRLYRMRL
jgi:hypothetical protein